MSEMKDVPPEEFGRYTSDKPCPTCGLHGVAHVAWHIYNGRPL